MATVRPPAPLKRASAARATASRLGGRLGVSSRQRRRQGTALGGRQRGAVARQRRAQQIAERRERQGDLCVRRTRTAHLDALVLELLNRCSPERGLADSRFAFQEEHPGGLDVPGDELADHLHLALAANDHLPSRPRRIQPHATVAAACGRPPSAGRHRDAPCRPSRRRPPRARRCRASTSSSWPRTRVRHGPGRHSRSRSSSRV